MLEYSRRTIGKAIQSTKRSVSRPELIIRGWPNHWLEFDGDVGREIWWSIYDVLGRWR